MGVVLVCDNCSRQSPPDLQKGMIAAPPGWWLQSNGDLHIAACGSTCLNLYLARSSTCRKAQSSERGSFGEASTD